IDLRRQEELDQLTVVVRAASGSSARASLGRTLLCSLGRFRQDEMGGVVRGGVLRALVAEVHRIDAGEEVLASAEENRGEHEVDLVDQPGGEVLPNGGNSTAEPDIF